MKPKILLILATVTALLGAFVYFVEGDLPSTDEKKELETKVLVVETDDVTAITLRSGDREVRLENAEIEPSDSADATPDDFAVPEWRIVAPLQARADTQAVTGLIRDLLALRMERSLEDVDTSAAGLDEPRAEVILTTKDGEVTLAVGTSVPLSEDALVLVKGVSGSSGGRGHGSRVVQTGFGDELLETVGREAGDWRDKRLFFARRSEVQSFAWTGPDSRRVLLARRGQGDKFWLEIPLQDRADTEKVRGLLSSLTALEASSFVDGSEDAESSSFNAERRFEVVLEGEEQPWVLELADTTDIDAGEPLARVDGQLVRLAASPVTGALGSPADDWRSHAWTHQQAFQIDEVILDQAGHELMAMRRDEADWRRSSGDAARVSENAEGEVPGDEIPYTAASDVLYGLTEAGAERLVAASDLTESGFVLDLSEPRLTLTLVNEDAEEILKLYGQIGPEGEEDLYAARSEGRDVVLLLPAATVTGLLDAIQALRDAEPVAPPVETADPP